MILGRTRLVIDDSDIDLGPAKQRGLLAWLLYHVNKPVTADTIGKLLWPNRQERQTRRSLYEHVSRIRKVFTEWDVPAKVVRETDAYTLQTDPGLIDYFRFVERVKTARGAAAAGDHHAVISALGDAVEWWTGPPLQELKSAEAEQTRELMVTVWGLLPAYQLLFDSMLKLGQHHDVLTRLAPVREQYPHDEALAKHWVQALAANGPRAARRRVPGTGEGREPGGEFVPPRQLSTYTREFTGHEDLLAEIDAAVDEPGAPAIIALTGMPGIGKTTLVKNWAYRRRDRFPDGSLYIDMRGYGSSRPLSPDDVLARFLHALGLPVDRIPAAGEQRRAKLGHLLADRRVLIVLDNAQNADHVRPLLPALTHGLVLITSRDRLKGLTVRDGVRAIPVPTLSLEESITLLGNLIGTRRASAEPSAVAALAELSSGLPLALWIIGQYIVQRRDVNLSELPGRLRAQLLREPDEDDEETTLHTVFSWTYGDLKATTARAFRLLGLHPAQGISTEAASALFGEPAERHLENLIRLHLLEHDARRYRMHDLLHMFARTRSKSDDSPADRRAAVRRMLGFYLLTGANAARRLAPQRSPVPGLPVPDGYRPMDFGTDAAAMEWCELERGNLAAMTQCAAEHGFHTIAWQLPGAVHEVFERYGPQDDILRSNEIGLESARIAGDHEAQIGTLNNLGATCLDVGLLSQAEKYCQEGLQLAIETHHRQGQAVCLQNLGNVYSELGNVRTAIRYFQLARKAYHEDRDPSGEAFGLHRLGLAYHRLERDQEALEHLTRALAIRVQIGHKRGEGATRAALARVCLDSRDFQAALDHGAHALTVLRPTKDRAMTCEALTVLAEAKYATGEVDEAIQFAREATEIAEDQIVGSRQRARALGILGRALDTAGDYEAARPALAEHLEILTDLGGPQLAEAGLTATGTSTSLAPPQRNTSLTRSVSDTLPKG